MNFYLLIEISFIKLEYLRKVMILNLYDKMTLIYLLKKLKFQCMHHIHDESDLVKRL